MSDVSPAICTVYRCPSFNLYVTTFGWCLVVCYSHPVSRCVNKVRRLADCNFMWPYVILWGFTTTSQANPWDCSGSIVLADLRITNPQLYRGAGKSLARPTYWCILFEGENISFDASLVIYINSTNIPPIMIINRIYELQNVLSL